MLQTVRAEVSIDGQVHLLEPLHVTQTSPAIVTLLPSEDSYAISERGNMQAVLQFLKDNPLPESSRRTPEEMEAAILEARESWD